MMKKAAEKSVGGGIGVCGVFGSTNPLHFPSRPLPRPLEGRASREKCKGAVFDIQKKGGRLP